MYSVHQHWDPLDTCIVGRTYPPEFYSWIKDKETRKRFETLAEETEADYQNLIGILKTFDVNVMRPEFPDNLDDLWIEGNGLGKWVQPPTAPRDYFTMIGTEFWVPEIPNASHAWSVFYRQNSSEEWPWFVRPQDFAREMPSEIVDPLLEKFETFKKFDQKHLDAKFNFYSHIFDNITDQGNSIVKTDLDFINGCFVNRIGEDLIFATQTYHDDKQALLEVVNTKFPDYNNRVVQLEGHGDSCYCPVTPGLIISTYDNEMYEDTYPDWEVVFLPDSNYANIPEFCLSMKHVKGRWFLPEFEKDHNLIHTVETYFDEWVGEVHETVFDVNILIVDPKNIIVSAHNDIVETACARYGINVHVSPFKHKYFWDAGIHCVTNDLNRLGERQNILAK